MASRDGRSGRIHCIQQWLALQQMRMHTSNDVSRCRVDGPGSHYAATSRLPRPSVADGVVACQWAYVSGGTR